MDPSLSMETEMETTMTEATSLQPETAALETAQLLQDVPEPDPAPTSPMQPDDAIAMQTDVKMTMETAMTMQMDTETMTMATAVSMAEASIQAQMDAVAMAEAGLAVMPEADTKAKEKKVRRKNLTDQERLSIVQYLLANSAGGRLKHGDMKAAATHFGVHRATTRRLWKLHLATSTSEGLAGNVASRIKGRSGRKPKVSDEEMKERIAAIPAERRMTGRGLSAALGLSNSVVVRLVREGKLRRHPKKLHYVM